MHRLVYGGTIAEDLVLELSEAMKWSKVAEMDMLRRTCAYIHVISL